MFPDEMFDAQTEASEESRVDGNGLNFETLQKAIDCLEKNRPPIVVVWVSKYVPKEDEEGNPIDHLTWEVPRSGFFGFHQKADIIIAVNKEGFNKIKDDVEKLGISVYGEVE